MARWLISTRYAYRYKCLPHCKKLCCTAAPDPEEPRSVEGDTNQEITVEGDTNQEITGDNKNKYSIIDKYSAAIITPFFSSVTERLDTTDKKVYLLFAERKEPEDRIWKSWVRTYFLTVLVLALFWFLVIFVDNLWY